MMPPPLNRWHPKNLAGRLRNLGDLARVLSSLDPDAREALRAVAQGVARENTQPRKGLHIDPTAMISPFASLRFTERVEIGPRALLHPYSFVWGGWSYTWARVEADASIGMGAVLVAGNHVIRAPGNMRYTGYEEADVIVERGAAVTANAVVIGARVGEGAFIGANAVVTSDIPARAIAVGAPARVIGYRPEE